MKKISIVLAIVMLLTMLAACGGDGNNTNTNDGQSVTDGVTEGSSSINSPSDFEGRKIAVQDETTADISIAEMVAGGMDIDVFRYPQVINCFDDLSAGRVDAVYVDSVVAAFYTTGNDVYKRVWLSSEDEPLGICLSKGSENLRDAICAAVDMLYYNGKMAEIGKAHFGNDFGSVRNVTSEPVIPTISDDDLKKPGTLMVGCDIGYPPMEYYADDGQTPVGFDIDVAKAIAEILGLEVEYVDTAWDGIFAGVDRGDYDCIISSVSITAEREQAFIFTQPYIANALCIVVKN